MPPFPPPPPAPPPPPLLINGRVPGAADVPAPPIEQNGTGVIEGVVKRPDNDEPIGEVQVTLIGPPTGTQAPAGQLSVTTDASGRFEFRDLPAARYTLRAFRENYFGPSLGGVPSQSVLATTGVDPLGNSQPITLHLVPAATIRGIVRDKEGRVALNVQLAAVQLSYRDGLRTLQAVKTVRSDDRGEYRLWGLPPGEFYVRAGEIGLFWKSDSAAAVYYPGVPDPEIATRIELLGGMETVADIQLPAAPAFRISGRVINTIPELATFPTAFVLVPMDADRLDDGMTGQLLMNQTRNRADGYFEIPAPRPGTYALMPVAGIRRERGTPLPPMSSGSPRYYTGSVIVDVRDRDLEDVTVAVTRGAALDVRVQGGALPTDSLSSVRLALRPAGAVATPLTMHVTVGRAVPDSGILQFSGVPAGRYALEGLVAPPGIYVADLRQGGRSIYETGIIEVGQDSAEPVELFIGAEGGQIEGTVAGAGDNLQRPVRISLVPEGARRGNPMFIKRATLSNGRFTLTGIAPGTYSLYAWESLLPGADENAEFMASFQGRGHPVTVAAGGTVQSVEVPLIPAR